MPENAKAHEARQRHSAACDLHVHSIPTLAQSASSIQQLHKVSLFKRVNIKNTAIDLHKVIQVAHNTVKSNNGKFYET
jgi:hypothetical protein